MAKHTSRRYPLKAWNDPAWKRKLSAHFTVSRVDEDIPAAEQGRERKPWYIALTQKPALLDVVGDVPGLPEGTTMLLSEDDVIALVRYLTEPQTALFVDDPSSTRLEKHTAYMFLEPGMVGIRDADCEIVNGEAHWTPEYFLEDEAPQPLERAVTKKVHTLPWPMLKKGGA